MKGTIVKRFVDVILPLPLANLYTYSLPEKGMEDIEAGYRVVVPFGRKKFYTAIVWSVHFSAPQEYETKEVLEILDTHPVLLPVQLKFWKWLADYYLCTLGDVYKAALPSGLKLESETIVEYNPDFEVSDPLPEREVKLLDILCSGSERTVTQLEKESGLKNLLPVVKSLLDREAIFIKEELKRNYKPRIEIRVKLTDTASTEDRLQELFNELNRAPKQLAVLMKYIELSGFMKNAPLREVSKRELLSASGASAAVFNGLVDKKVFGIYPHEIGRLDYRPTETEALHPLNAPQQEAYLSILESFKEKNVCLLHGVTSSGKTEIYIHLIREALKAGKQALYLLPEIALTTQITRRLKRVFGDQLGIYHSKFSDAERVEIWQKQLSDQDYRVVLGVRSSIFLPFKDLGLVIIDEEHENTYKQQDPAPRYHARNAAILLASFYSAKTLLGTATPSVETYFNATSGKYGWVELTERYQSIQLPEIKLVDIKELFRKKRMNAQFSPDLLAHIQEALSKKEQVILFQNRRGFAPMVECKVCGWVPKCKNCDVSLTYHKSIRQLTCHYCGSIYEVPSVCPACGSVELMNRGFGTERIEDDIKQIFPEAGIARMDLDTARTRTAYEKIIADFESGKTDILIGTQMVSKGLDFDRVSVVGILNADTMLNYPDFRSYERAYQLMAQVAGRAGRKNSRGLVVLQTKSADLPVIHHVMENDYVQMYRDQLAERQLFKYPPYYRLVYVYLKHRKEDLLEVMAHTMAERLRTFFDSRILGPDRPAVSRIQTLFIRKIVVKIENSASLPKVRELLLRVRHEMMEDERFRSSIVYYDVDPM